MEQKRAKSVRGLYKKQRLILLYACTSDVMYKKFQRLVYTPPDLSARLSKVDLPNTKIRPDFLFSTKECNLELNCNA